MNKPKPSLKEAQDKCKCDAQIFGKDCHTIDCSKKPVVNKGNLVVKELSTPSVSGWEESIKRKNWTSEDWKNSKDHIDRLVYFIAYLSPHNLWKAHEDIASLLLKQREEFKEEYKEGVNYGIWKQRQEWREKMKSLKNKYVGKGNVYENEDYHKIMEELV